MFWRSLSPLSPLTPFRGQISHLCETLSWNSISQCMSGVPLRVYGGELSMDFAEVWVKKLYEGLLVAVRRGEGGFLVAPS